MDEVMGVRDEQVVDVLLTKISALESSLSAAQEKQEFFYNQCKQKDLKIRNLDAIFAANHRETLDMVVDNFITNGRISLKKISSQVHIQEFDADNVRIMTTLIDYLYHLIEQLENLREEYR